MGCQVIGFTPKSVGQHGDARAYELGVVLAFPPDADLEQISKIATTVVNEVRGVTRVLMDIIPTTKKP